MKLDSKQFKGQVEVNTNLDFVVSTEGAVTITEKKKNLISFTVSENTLWKNRTSKITVKDTEGLLEKSLVIVQDKNNGNNDTDRDALIAIAKSVNMNEWEENGVLRKVSTEIGVQIYLKISGMEANGLRKVEWEDV